jgi:peptide/nickel transport system substrate-binding protein
VRKSLVRTSAIVCLVALGAFGLAACGSSSKNSSGGSGPAATAAPKAGGAVVFGAEQWPDCINPITQCANSSWLQWLVPIHVLPRLMELNATNEFVPSPLLAGPPTVTAGPPMTVTYKLNPAAKWSDGTPITSADVQFSWRAYLDTTGSLSTAGYDQVNAVTMPDAQTAVFHFVKPYADWQDVGGGFSGVILEKKMFPAGTNVSKSMQTSIPFSGGPWKLISFSKTQEVLEPNTNYWDTSRKPLLDKVTFIPVTDTSVEVQNLKSGQVSAIYPQPVVDNVKALTNQPGIKTSFGTTTQYENIWYNEKPGKPFADPNIRAAFSYAFDRNKFLNDIVKPFDPNATLLNCAAWLPAIDNWCTNTDWADVTFDPSQVASYMQKSGYAKDGSGIWAKNGKELVLHWMENTGNTRRENTQKEFIPLLAQQGFKVVTDNSTADTMFQQRLPTGDYDFSMFIQVTSPDPTVTSILSTGQIPSAANKGNGQNDWWYSNASADALMTQSDANLDHTSRETQIHNLDKILRKDFLLEPLYAFPVMASFNTAQITGPVDQYINNPESVFWNMWAWSKP